MLYLQPDDQSVLSMVTLATATDPCEANGIMTTVALYKDPTCLQQSLITCPAINDCYSGKQITRRADATDYLLVCTQAIARSVSARSLRFISSGWDPVIRRLTRKSRRLLLRCSSIVLPEEGQLSDIPCKRRRSSIRVRCNDRKAKPRELKS